MTKSKQINHEYYANYETCRNRLFDEFDPEEGQIEDEHLSYGEALAEDICKGESKHGKKRKHR